MRHRLFILATALLFSSCAEKGDIDAADLLACGVFDPEKQICDKRDGNLYKFVKIDAQVWLAENLKYNSPSSVCYEYDPENCEIYGRLYLWDKEGNKKLCPEGWHIPSDKEWESLEKLTKSDKYLKADTGWYSYTKDNTTYSGNGNDIYGFSALPAGISKYEEDDCDNHKNNGALELAQWNGLGSATAFMPSVLSYKMVLLSDTTLTPCIAENSLVSVRCVKD